MGFDKQELKDSFIEMWKARKNSGASHTKKTWDEKAADWEKELTEDDEIRERSNIRVSETGSFLRENGLLLPSDRVIDIGCGPGRFVAEFARTAGFVTGTDISPNMCELGRNYARSRNLENVEFIACDFKETDIETFGWKEKFDLVFSSITPAMSTYESFRKAESMSRKYCFQSNYVKTEDPLGEEVLAEALGDKFRQHKRGVQVFLAMFNILCLEGCFPVVKFFSETSCRRETVNGDLVRRILKTVPGVDKTEELKQDLLKALQKRMDDDGMIERKMEWVYGWILWDIRQKQKI